MTITFFPPAVVCVSGSFNPDSSANSQVGRPRRHAARPLHAKQLSASLNFTRRVFFSPTSERPPCLGLWVWVYLYWRMHKRKEKLEMGGKSGSFYWGKCVFVWLLTCRIKSFRARLWIHTFSFFIRRLDGTVAQDENSSSASSSGFLLFTLMEKFSLCRHHGARNRLRK